MLLQPFVDKLMSYGVQQMIIYRSVYSGVVVK